MPDNASRRGAVDMGMPLMILAFLVIGGFMWWLKGQAADEMAARVVEEVVEEAAVPEGGVELGEVTAVGTDATAFVGEVIRGVGYEVASVFGTAGFWVTTQNGNPFLVAYTEELRATGITVQQGDIVDVSGEFLVMEISYLDEWLAEGTIDENDKLTGEFGATHFVAATDVAVTGTADAADPGDGGGD